jgi:hypothetical protein
MRRQFKSRNRRQSTCIWENMIVILSESGTPELLKTYVIN